MNIKPLADRVVIKMLEAEETTVAVLSLPEQQRRNLRLRKLWRFARAALLTRKRS